LQPRVLCPGFLKDGNGGVGILPEGDEILIGSVGLEDLALHGISPGETGFLTAIRFCV
jgi:hypothetical protein